ncbi:MAG: SDR family NAD(P)-dependent oxidoreductase [Acetobacteraceae bacterium]
MFSLQGKTAVITGAGRGIGRAIAERFAAAGANVVLAARGEAEIHGAAEAIIAAGGVALAQRTDVREPASLAELAEATTRRFGRIDTWVNNAGGISPEPGGLAEWIDAEPEAIAAMLRLNLMGPVFGAQAAARAMRNTGGGSILFISSIDALFATPGGEGIYGACKAATNHVVTTMAVELGQYRIRVNAIAPAVIETALTASWLRTPEDRAARSALYPLGRIGKPEDVAAAALYLVSDEASWVSGAVLLVSGGAVYTSDPYRYLTALAAANKG